jgi:formylglycine-generating enzyme required for sulfatase activity
VRAAQRAGTKLVDIDYDVAGATSPVEVRLQVSPDGGATWAVPVTSVTGAVGYSVTARSNLRITWNAGVDWYGQYSTQMRFRVVVYDPFVTVVGGTLPSTSLLGAVPVSTFYIGTYEVQWGEFQAVRTWAAANGYDIGSVGAGSGSNYPVTNVSWYQAVKWCNARSEQEGKTPVYTVGGVVYRTGDQVPVVNTSANGYRLPSEKEWEWAARGGTQTNGYTYSGSNDINAVAWYSGNSGSATHVVGTKAANELGTHDMNGNVSEWCFDASGPSRVFRGGSWSTFADYCAVRYRLNFYANPTYSDDNIGFRLALSSVP